MNDAPQPVEPAESGRESISGRESVMGPQHHDVPQMSGFLFKKSTNGDWQKRYFETNGSFLTYYKSQKMTKLLAALSLPSVGGIQLIGEVSDLKGTGSIFQLDLKDRQYILRTSTLEEAQMWVDTLIQLRDSAGASAAANAANASRRASAGGYQAPGPNDPPPPALRGGGGGGGGGFVKEPRGTSALERCCVCM